MPDSSHAGGTGGNDAFILIMEQGDMALNFDKDQNSYYGVKIGEVLLL